MQSRKMDDWLRERVDEYDDWIEKGMIPFSSKVVPIGASLEAKQWVLPSEQVLEFFRNARSIGLGNCVCRSHYKRCDNPRDICFFLNDAADKLIEKGRAQRVSFETARGKLALADEYGLVHMTLYNPKQYPYAICNCCACCCHELQLLRDHGRKDLIGHSEYVAVQDQELCSDCGDCVERCVFGAREYREGNLFYEPERCHGCGLCVTACSTGSIELRRKRLK